MRNRQPAAVITEAGARRLWPGEDPLGQRLRRGQSGPLLEIIGTIGNSPNRALYEDEADVISPVTSMNDLNSTYCQTKHFCPAVTASML